MHFLNHRDKIVYDDTRTKLADFLNTYLSAKVWNETLAEYRHNVIPYMVGNMSHRGIVNIHHQVLQLPTSTDSYYVYILPHGTMSGLTMEVPTWTTLDTYLATNNLLLRVHGNEGQMFYRNKIFLITNSVTNDVYLAVDKKMVCRINSQFKDSYNNKIYVAPYYDCDIPNDMTLECYCPATDQERADVLAKCKSATTVYLNGREAINLVIENITIGDFVEIINDETVFCQFDIDLQNPMQNKQFNSTRDGIVKQIIHIPSALNPDNRVITNNTCDIFVRPKIEDGANTKGLFLHRCQYGAEIAQITHNDFSIPHYVLESYKEYLECSEITLHVICRLHSQINHLVRTKDYIDLLYTHDEDIILDFLENVNKPMPAKDINWWSADILENSEYVKMLDGIPDFVKPDVVSKYVDTLGYHNTMALVNKSIQRKYVPDVLSHELVLDVPLLFRPAQVYVSVFIQGIKLDEDLVNIGNIIDGTVKVTINDSVPFVIGDELITEMYEKLPLHTKTFNPTADANTFTIPYDRFYIYQELTLTVPVKGIDIQSSKSYKDIDLSDVADVVVTDIITITFKEASYGNKYILQNKEGIYTFDTNVVLATDKNPIVIDLITTADNLPGVTYPILDEIGTLVYINGFTLVEDIDFKVYEVKDPNGNVAIRQLVISNVSYLTLADNKIEAKITREDKQGIYHGFLTEATSEIPLDSVAYYYPQVSMLAIDGRIIKDVTIKGNNINLVNLKLREGALYGVRTLFTNNALEYIEAYAKDTDTVRLTILRDYFHRVEHDDVEFIVLPFSHRLYSLYLSIIFRDVSDGTKKVAFDPDIDNLMAQVEEYAYLKHYDLVFTEELDLNYIDLFPSYTNYVTPGVPNYNALTAIALHELPKDDVTDVKAYTKI